VNSLYSDAHCHFRHLPYDAVKPTIKRIEDAGVELALVASVDVGSSEQEVSTAERFGILKACVGIHPWNADLCNKSAIRKLKELAANENVVAISEIGLDYFSRRNREKNKFENIYIDKDIQRTAFREQLRLAKELELPVIVHDRVPDQEVLDMLEAEGNAKTGAVIHGFDKDSAYARRCVELGIYMSIGFGKLMPEFLATTPIHQRPMIKVVPEKERDALKEVIAQTDLKYLLTDSDRQGDGVFAIVKKIAEIKGLTKEDVAYATTQNLRKLTRLL